MAVCVKERDLGGIVAIVVLDPCHDSARAVWSGPAVQIQARLLGHVRVVVVLPAIRVTPIDERRVAVGVPISFLCLIAAVVKRPRQALVAIFAERRLIALVEERDLRL